MQSREAIVDQIRSWLKIRHAAVQQDKYGQAREANLAATQLVWVLEEDFIEDIDEIDDEWQYDEETDYIEQIGNELEEDCVDE